MPALGIVRLQRDVRVPPKAGTIGPPWSVVAYFLSDSSSVMGADNVVNILGLPFESTDANAGFSFSSVVKRLTLRTLEQKGSLVLRSFLLPPVLNPKAIDHLSNFIQDRRAAMISLRHIIQFGNSMQPFDLQSRI